MVAGAAGSVGDMYAPLETRAGGDAYGELGYGDPAEASDGNE